MLGALPMELKSDEDMQSFLNRLKTHTIETIDIGNLKENLKESRYWTKESIILSGSTLFWIKLWIK